VAQVEAQEEDLVEQAQHTAHSCTNVVQNRRRRTNTQHSVPSLLSPNRRGEAQVGTHIPEDGPVGVVHPEQPVLALEVNVLVALGSTREGAVQVQRECVLRQGGKTSCAGRS
jgi:hypothetical protein